MVPLAIVGTRKVMPKGRLQAEPADVTLIVHDPIPAPKLENPTIRDAKAWANQVQAIVKQSVEGDAQPA